MSTVDKCIQDADITVKKIHTKMHASSELCNKGKTSVMYVYDEARNNLHTR